MKTPLALLLLLMAVAPISTLAGQQAVLHSPAARVLCDRRMCANEGGISVALTRQYLGKKAAIRLGSQGDFDRSEFTFGNGVFCDVKQRLCRADRYYGADGQRSASVNEKYTEQLFGHPAGTPPSSR